LALRDWLAIALVIVASAGSTNVGGRWKPSSPPAVD
jgi:threonine/homoserine efflux transporter RhtA